LGKKMSKGMAMILRSVVVALVAALVLGACTQSSRPVATGKGNLRAINSIIGSPDIGFLVEERLQSNINYKETSTRRIDDLSYKVNFEVNLAGGTTRTRIASQNVDVVANTEYVFALTGTLTAPVIMSHEFPERQWSGNETVFEVRVLHLATTAADLDVYYAAPGTVPVLGEARTTVAYGELSAPFETAAGDYEFILTTRDDPNDIRYRSRSLAQTGATAVLFGLFDPDPSITGNLSVRVMGAGNSSAELPDVDFPPTVRLMHAALSTGNVDFFANNDFTTALASNLGFSEVTADFDFPFADAVTPVTITPNNDTGVLLLEDALTAAGGTRNSAFLVGAPAALDIITFPDSRRPIDTLCRVRLVDLSSNIASVDLYIYLAGTDINDASVIPAYRSLPFKASTGYANLKAGSYQIAVTLPGDKNIIAGPLSLDLATGDIVELALLDTVDPTVPELLVYDN
jgi:hypothetical protein